MPVKVSYPGVYIDEVKSSVRTITGVPTSIAAFVGWAPRGRTDRPVHITSWADYEKEFGGLHRDSAMSYAVEQFYRNGGAEAEIVRVVSKPSQQLKLTLGKKSNGPKVRPIGPGGWVKNLRARVESVLGDDGKPVKHVYNLRIRDHSTGVEETYLNVSEDPDSPRSLQLALAGSQLVTWESDGEPPTPNDTVEGLDDQMGDEDTPDESDEGSAEESGEGEGEERPSRPPVRVGGNKVRFTVIGDVPGDLDDLPDFAAYKPVGGEAGKSGLYQLLKTDIFNILCLPEVTVNDNLSSGEREKLLSDAADLCVKRRAVLLVDPPTEWTAAATAGDVADLARRLPLRGDDARNAALYFPRILASDSRRDGLVRDFPPCGVMAGVMARTDAQRGVWKAPAGTDASLNGVQGLEMPLTDLENGRLNPLGVNCLRELPAVGPVAWGARTMRGNDQLTDEWKYLPVRRLALFVEESLFRGTQWVVFEPNDEPLWASIRLNIGAFMNSLFREGAFQGRTPAEAYLVKCDRENNPQNDIDRGIVNIQVGFAPLKPAEFVIIHIQQLAGQVQV
ncbi:phage tail sheath family protein [Streptomyces rectiverticillatus]|uniref:phage tail sheath family protein n=1 Tax=Streptomyces rectiverticillatus TaxID=173860 RepID=UPI0015C2D8F3|nr:phage tail sheath C-terminal domain-containing protein [Streptomyces rectiverticillatus]QLE75096.1 phage tail sheath family protein [Streptomyces rectiverticillatus]